MPQRNKSKGIAHPAASNDPDSVPKGGSLKKFIGAIIDWYIISPPIPAVKIIANQLKFEKSGLSSGSPNLIFPKSLKTSQAKNTIINNGKTTYIHPKCFVMKSRIDPTILSAPGGFKPIGINNANKSTNTGQTALCSIFKYFIPSMPP